MITNFEELEKVLIDELNIHKEANKPSEDEKEIDESLYKTYEKILKQQLTSYVKFYRFKRRIRFEFTKELLE